MTGSCGSPPKTSRLSRRACRSKASSILRQATESCSRSHWQASQGAPKLPSPVSFARSRERGILFCESFSSADGLSASARFARCLKRFFAEYLHRQNRRLPSSTMDRARRCICRRGPAGFRKKRMEKPPDILIRRDAAPRRPPGQRPRRLRPHPGRAGRWDAPQTAPAQRQAPAPGRPASGQRDDR